ncbi:site-specific integrase [Pleomorphomonas oryzae]|uniref:site-specific integrase n=1 Tax=Pleomorphomonas oryzae TaxID=261934 RepID=UPI00047E0874|nr:site-specific integrase [Pleomorphomonas oryzae]
MGSIVERKRKDGSTSYLAKVSVMKDKVIVHSEAKTFDRRPAAAAWIKAREKELSEPGGIERLNASSITLEKAIEKYEATARKPFGKTKVQVLNSLKAWPIGQEACIALDSQKLVEFGQWLLDGDREPSTVGNYISHLASVFAVAKPAWGIPLDMEAMEGARAVMTRLGIIARPKERTRRPTIDEASKIVEHFDRRAMHRSMPTPMATIVVFAIFSTRRQEEIVRIRWTDLDEEGSRVLVRDMKHPGEKIGNDQWCNLVPEALEIIKAQPRTADEIFPYTTDAITAAFTRACQFLGIEDLHFHDLRHEGISRLFEMGWNIPQVAAVSGHRSWSSLRRYTHMRQTGDKWAGWPWLAKMTAQTLL